MVLTTTRNAAAQVKRRSVSLATMVLTMKLFTVGISDVKKLSSNDSDASDDKKQSSMSEENKRSYGGGDPTSK